METVADKDMAYLLQRKPDASENDIEAFIEVTSRIWQDEGNQDDDTSRDLAFIALFGEA